MLNLYPNHFISKAEWEDVSNDEDYDAYEDVYDDFDDYEDDEDYSEDYGFESGDKSIIHKVPARTLISNVLTNNICL